MRRVVFALVLTGCGGFLPFFGDDDDPAPSPPAVADATADTAEGSSDGFAGELDAASDAPVLVWSCTTTAPSTPTSEQQCNAERLGVCNSPDEPPIDLPCSTLGEGVAHCPQVCQKSSVGASTYSYTLTSCVCARQP